MNERIQTLYEQSRIGRGLGYDIEKFAELIARECAYLVDNVLEERSPPNPTLGEQLMKQFGVE